MKVSNRSSESDNANELASVMPRTFSRERRARTRAVSTVQASAHNEPQFGTTARCLPPGSDDDLPTIGRHGVAWHLGAAGPAGTRCELPPSSSTSLRVQQFVDRTPIRVAESLE